MSPREIADAVLKMLSDGVMEHNGGNAQVVVLSYQRMSEAEWRANNQKD